VFVKSFHLKLKKQPQNQQFAEFLVCSKHWPYGGFHTKFSAAAFSPPVGGRQGRLSLTQVFISLLLTNSYILHKKNIVLVTISENFKYVSFLFLIACALLLFFIFFN